MSDGPNAEKVFKVTYNYEKHMSSYIQIGEKWLNDGCERYYMYHYKYTKIKICVGVEHSYSHMSMYCTSEPFLIDQYILGSYCMSTSRMKE